MRQIILLLLVFFTVFNFQVAAQDYSYLDEPIEKTAIEKEEVVRSEVFIPFKKYEGHKYFNINWILEGGGHPMYSNGMDLNRLRPGILNLGFEFEAFPLDIIGIGFSTAISNLSEYEVDPSVTGRGGKRELYGILRIPFMNYSKVTGWFGLYGGSGKIFHQFEGIDPQDPEVIMDSEGETNFLGVKVNLHGGSTTGFIIDAGFRETVYPSFQTTGTNYTYMNNSSGTPLYASVGGFYLKLGMSINIF